MIMLVIGILICIICLMMAGLPLKLLKLLELPLNKLTQNINPILLTKPINHPSLYKVLNEYGSLKPIAHPTARIYRLLKIL